MIGVLRKIILSASVMVILALSGGCSRPAVSAAAIIPTDLRTEYATNPLGLDGRRPRLSWSLDASDPKSRGLKQTAYQILVAGSEAALNADRGDLWDSGKVMSDETIHVEYQGAPLGSRKQCWWKVKAWDQLDQSSDWSQSARWEMGLLDPDEWKARWIQDTDPVVADHNGYRCRLEESPDIEKWVVIDLLEPREVDLIRLFPSKPIDIQPEQAGYLFPARFRIDLSDSPGFDSHVTIIDQTKRTFANPGSRPVEFTINPRKGRYVRLLVTRLADDGTGEYGFALAEMEVFGNGRRLSRGGAKVSASDSFEEGAWSLENLNDWVTVSQKGRAGQPAPASMMRTTFSLNQRVARARIYVSALGVYEFRINGERVGQNVLSPEWTDYSQRVMVQTFDVTDMLNQGENALAAITGEGWYCGYIPFFPGRRHYGNKPRVIVQLEITYQDGGQQTIISDDSWKATREGPIRRSVLIDGEVYDARKEMPGWDKPGFDDSQWKPVALAESVETRLVGQYNEPIQVTTEIKPVSVSEPSPGVYVVDMGQNMVGWVRARFRGPAGTQVTLRHAEMLKEDGNIYTDNMYLAGLPAAATDVYIMRGDETEEIFEPHFTFRGFRYLEVSGLNDKPAPEMFVGKVIHSATPKTGTFECSDPMLNKLMQNIWWTQIGNMTGIPTDCPQRGERGGWMGDAQAFDQTSMFNMNMVRFYTKWLQDIRDAQSPDGGFSSVAPSPLGRAGTFPNAPGWADAGITVPWHVYVHYGDKRILEDQFDAAVRYIESIRKANPDLIWRKNRGEMFADWLNGDSLDIPDYPKRGAATPFDLFATAFFAHSTECLSRMAAAIGRDSEAEDYRQLAGQIKAAFQREFLLPDGRLKAAPSPPAPRFADRIGNPISGDTQTAYALALHFNLIPEELRMAAAARMVGRIEEYGWRLSTGFHGTSRLMLALADTGHADVAYRLLLNRTVPSWAYMIDQGATTIWERWDGYVKGRGFQNAGMNSFNHYAFGAVGEWMYRNVAGINPDPDKPGYKHILLRPRPGGGLTDANGTFASIRGPILSHWKLDGGVFHWNVTIPPNTTATIHVPAESVTDVRESGMPIEQAEGVQFIRLEDGTVVIEAGSGSFQFASKLPGPRSLEREQ